MFDPIYRSFILLGVNYFLIVLAITFLIVNKKKLSFFLVLIISIVVYILGVLPFAQNYLYYYLNRLPTDFQNDLFTTVGYLGFANLFILFLSFYKQYYLRQIRYQVIFVAVLTYALYLLGLISAELELIFIFIILVTSIGFILYKIEKEPKELPPLR